MATRGPDGKFVKKSRLVENGVPQRPIDVERAVINYATAAQNADTETAREFWTRKLWKTRTDHGYVSQLATFTESMTH